LKSGGYGAVWRFLAYMLLLIGLGGILNGIALLGEISNFKEGGIVEWMQFGVLATATAVLLNVAARKLPEAMALPLLASFLTMIAMFREMDLLLRENVPVLSWHIPVFVLSLGFLGIVWRMRRQLLSEFRRLTVSAFFPLLWAGLAVVIFGQMVGHGDFLEPLLESCYHRDYKRLLEESFEMMGYFFIFVGCLELRFEANGYAQSPEDGPDG